MRYLFFLLIIVLIEKQVIAKSPKGIFLIGFGSASSIHRQNPNNTNDQFEFVGSENWENEASGLELHLLVPTNIISFGLGVASGTVNAKSEYTETTYNYYTGYRTITYKSNLRITSSSSDFSFVFSSNDDKFFLQIGQSLGGTTNIEELRLLNVDYNKYFDYKSDKTESFFINLGLSGKGEYKDMYVVFGSRFWDVSVKQYLNDQHTNTYSAKYSLGSVGIGTNY